MTDIPALKVASPLPNRAFSRPQREDDFGKEKCLERDGPGAGGLDKEPGHPDKSSATIS